jgi:hypothetical protein
MWFQICLIGLLSVFHGATHLNQNDIHSNANCSNSIVYLTRGLSPSRRMGQMSFGPNVRALFSAAML